MRAFLAYYKENDYIVHPIKDAMSIVDMINFDEIDSYDYLDIYGIGVLYIIDMEYDDSTRTLIIECELIA